MSSIDTTLAERGNRYGEFVDHADITQTIKAAMSLGQNWDSIDNDMREALEMVAHKIGRILNGDPNYIDSWTDIIGYTRLVEKRLIDEQSSVKGMMSTAPGTPTPVGEEKCGDPRCPACHPETAGTWMFATNTADPVPADKEDRSFGNTISIFEFIERALRKEIADRESKAGLAKPNGKT